MSIFDLGIGIGELVHLEIIDLMFIKEMIVPVIAIFTKFDVRDDIAYEELEGNGSEATTAAAMKQAEETLLKNDVSRIMGEKREIKNPPASYICLRSTSFPLAFFSFPSRVCTYSCFDRYE